MKAPFLYLNHLLRVPLGLRTSHTIAANIAPATGATINSQSCESACPPANIAGPKLRVGFTDVPVIGMATKWINAKVRPIANPAIVEFPTLEVVAKITNKKINVKTASVKNAAVIPYSF